MFTILFENENYKLYKLLTNTLRNTQITVYFSDFCP